MHRELNPELFGVKSPGDSNLSLNQPSSQDLGVQTSHGNKVPPAVAAELRTLEAMIQQLKIQLQNSEKRNEILAAQFQELIRATTGRFEKTTQAVARVESACNQQIQELNAKYSGISSKVNERKVQDTKIQEMIDRHNSIVRTFENRLTHMQRVISEQEMQLHNSQATLEEARHDLARLKTQAAHR